MKDLKSDKMFKVLLTACDDAEANGGVRYGVKSDDNEWTDRLQGGTCLSRLKGKSYKTKFTLADDTTKNLM